MKNNSWLFRLDSRRFTPVGYWDEYSPLMAIRVSQQVNEMYCSLGFHGLKIVSKSISFTRDLFVSFHVRPGCKFTPFSHKPHPRKI